MLNVFRIIKTNSEIQIHAVSCSLSEITRVKGCDLDDSIILIGKHLIFNYGGLKTKHLTDSRIKTEGRSKPIEVDLAIDINFHCCATRSQSLFMQSLRLKACPKDCSSILMGSLWCV